MSSRGAVLVTGGAGYIGSVTVRHLLSAGYPVVVLDDLSRGHRDAVPAPVRFVHGSIASDAALSEALDGPDSICAILHFAAFAYVGESMLHPGMYFANNTAATVSLARAAVRRGIGRLVFSSSCAVYGEPVRIPVTEDAPLAPISPYGESKRQCEEALRWMARAHGLRVAILRYFNAVGAAGDAGERHDPEPHLVPRALAAAVGEQPPLTVHGSNHPTRDGTCERDFIHVSDVARAHRIALDELDHEPMLTLNLGTGRGATVLEVLQSVQRVTGRPVPYDVGPARVGDPAALVASADRARHMLGWAPERPGLDEMIADSWDFWRRAAVGSRS